MWVYVFDEPIPTYGNNGKKFLLHLHYRKYYGHRSSDDEFVVGVWDSLNECFYEEKTMLEIANEDISAWWKDV